MGNNSDAPDLPPPSYDEAIHSNPSTPRPARPPASRPTSTPSLPARPSSQPTSHYRPGTGAPGASGATAQLYTGNLALPFTFPKGFLCPKCKNTGYRIKKGNMCRDCWMRFYLTNHAYNPNPNLPFQYPTRFLCEKCENTGIKRKNGKSCQDCYEMFAPRNASVQPMVTYPSAFDSLFGGSTTYTTFVPAGVPMMGGPGPAGAPIRVPPGDPRLGGVLCGKCRGLGKVYFLLDEDLCPVCYGVGRIITQPPPQPQGFPPPQQYAPQPYPPQQYAPQMHPPPNRK